MSAYLFYDKSAEMIGVFDKRLRWLQPEKETVKNGIYIARIIKQLPELNAYFLEYEKSKIGFLRSQKKLKIGESYLVEGRVDAKEEKKPRFHLGYTYLYFPYLYDDIHQTSEEIFLKELKNNVSSAQKEYRKHQLKEKIQWIRTQSKFLPIPRKILQKSKHLEKIMTKYRLEQIITNSPEIYKNYCKWYQVKLDEQYSYAYDRNISKDLIALSSRKLKLPCGAEIIIDRTEAMTVIDVNSAGATCSIAQINQEAMEEILIQIDLRHIIGILLVDFINEDSQTLMAWIHRKIKNTNIHFYGKTNLQIYEFSISG